MDMGLVFLACAAIVGLLEWVKYLWKAAPAWVWHVALLPLAALTVVLLPGSAGTRVLMAGVVLLVCQVGYQLIIQGVIGLIKAAVAKAKK